MIKLIFALLCYGVHCAAAQKDGLDSIATGTQHLQTGTPPDSIHITMPVPRIVFQRGNNNRASVPVKGTVFPGAGLVEARLVPRSASQGVSTRWFPMRVSAQNTFSGIMNVSAGWYDLLVRIKTGSTIVSSSKVERVGVGEVFIVVGHSVAQGGDINIDGATDDRVSTVALQEHSAENEKYLKTADTQYLPPAAFVQAKSGVAHAPFGHNSYFWSRFGELVVKKENVPVLIFNAAFGGTNLEHWAKSARGIPFEHGFVKSAIRMPYINLLNTFTKYIPVTGVRALLADHGQNDWRENNADTIFNNYRIFIQHARTDLGYRRLAMVVNRQTPKDAPAVRQAQERMAREPDCFPGPDYDTLLTADKVDGIHLSASGAAKAAVMWAAALTPSFYIKSTPLQARIK